MQIDLLCTRSELHAIREEWESLPRPSVMQSPTWLCAWWDAYQSPNRELSVVTVRDGERLIGIAPWYAESTRGGRRLRWMGDGQACSDHATILCETEQEQHVAQAVADRMMDASADPWQQVALDSVDDDSLVVRQLIDRLADRGCPISHQEEPGSCYVDLPESWDDYLASVSKNHRKKCRRNYKQFFETGRAQIEVMRTAEACLSAFDLLVRQHNDRREALGGKGAFCEPRFRKFHCTAIGQLAALEKVQLRVLNVDGEPVATEYALEEGNKLYSYQGGLSAKGEEISAGALSMIALVRDAIDAGYRQIDLLRGVEPYKFSWGAQHRPATTYVVRRATTAGRIGAWHDSAWSNARAFKRRLISTT